MTHKFYFNYSSKFGEENEHIFSILHTNPEVEPYSLMNAVHSNAKK